MKVNVGMGLLSGPVVIRVTIAVHSCRHRRAGNWAVDRPVFRSGGVSIGDWFTTGGGRMCEDRRVTSELIDQARRGDEQAFGQLVDRYRSELQVHCYRFLGKHSAH